MIGKFLIAFLVILGVFTAWILVQQAVRKFAVRHPEWGDAREEGGECGISCGCKRKRDCFLKKVKH